VNFTSNVTVNGADPTVATGNCGNIGSGGNNLGCTSALHLQDVDGVSLTRVVVNGSAQMGINGFDVSGLAMTNVEVLNAGNGTNEHGVQLYELSGTNTVTNSNFHNNRARQFFVENNATTMTLNVSGSNFSDNIVPGPIQEGQQGFLMSTNPPATNTLRITNNTFRNTFSNGFDFVMNGGTNSLRFTGNTVQNTAGYSNNIRGDYTYLLDNNDIFIDATYPFSTSAAISVNVPSGTATGTVNGTITNNRIGRAGVPFSGAKCGGGCSGISADKRGTGNYRVLIQGNTIRHTDLYGIDLEAGQGTGRLDARVTGNTVTEPDNNAGAETLEAIRASNRVLAADTTVICADITANTLNGAWDPVGGGDFIRVNNGVAAANSFILPGFAGDGTNLAVVETFLSVNNSGVNTAATRLAPAAYSGGAACTAPTTPAP
jgi:hypothetical protein